MRGVGALDQQRLYDVTKWCADFNTFERKTFVKSRYDEEEIEKKNKLLMKRELKTESFARKNFFFDEDTRVDVLYWHKRNEISSFVELNQNIQKSKPFRDLKLKFISMQHLFDECNIQRQLLGLWARGYGREIIMDFLWLLYTKAHRTCLKSM